MTRDLLRYLSSCLFVWLLSLIRPFCGCFIHRKYLIVSRFCVDLKMCTLPMLNRLSLDLSVLIILIVVMHSRMRCIESYSFGVRKLE